MRWPRAALLVALTLPCLTTARSMLNASVLLRANAAALGLDVLVDPVPVPAANKSFWSIAYPEDYFDPQCHGKPRTVIEDCECACNALGGTLACIESREQSALVHEDFPHEYLFIGAYQRTAQNAHKGWRWTAAASPENNFMIWETHDYRDEGVCAVEQCVY